MLVYLHKLTPPVKPSPDSHVDDSVFAGHAVSGTRESSPIAVEKGDVLLKEAVSGVSQGHAAEGSSSEKDIRTGIRSGIQKIPKHLRSLNQQVIPLRAQWWLVKLNNLMTGLGCSTQRMVHLLLLRKPLLGKKRKCMLYKMLQWT